MTSPRISFEHKHNISSQQRNAASLFWGQLLHGDRRITQTDIDKLNVLQNEMVSLLNMKDPLWLKKFIDELNNLIFEHRHDANLKLKSDILPEGILLQAAKNTKIPPGIFPNNVSMTFAENDKIIVNGRSYPAAQIIDNNPDPVELSADLKQPKLDDAPEDSGFTKAAGEEIGIAIVAHGFKTAPDRYANVVPENKRTLKQKAFALGADGCIDIIARATVTGNMPVSQGAVICSTAAITKAIVLKNHGPEFPPRNKIELNDVKVIGKASMQGGLIRMAQTQTTTMTSTLLQNGGALAATGICATATPIMASIFVSPLAQSGRLPNTSQTPDEDKSLLQEAGHLVVNTGISVAVGMGTLGMVTATPSLVALGLMGTGIGVVANTIVGKERSVAETKQHTLMLSSRSI